jgi:uncharacterized protein YbjQ (UPF0145 family)
VITIFSTILGALTGLVPGILQYFTKKADNAQQIALKQLDMQAAKEAGAIQVDVANSQSDIAQQQHLYTFAGGPTGVKWVDALTALVRPIVTFVMFGMWLAVTAALLIYGIRSGFDLVKLAALVWTPATEAIFGAIMGFWFGNRMLVRGNQQMAATQAVQPSPVTARAKPAVPRPNIIPDPPGSRT